MTNPRVVINALKEIEAALDRFSRDIQQSMSSADAFINGTQHAIERCRTELEYNLEQARAALIHCRSSGYTDADGRYVEPNCSGEEQIVHTVEQQIVALRYLANAVEGALRSYRSHAARMSSLSGSTIASAAGFVHERLDALVQFETSGTLMSAASAVNTLISRVGTVASGLISDAQKSHGHGYDYERSRQAFLRTLVDDPNQPQFVRGWVKQEMNRIESHRVAKERGLRPSGGSYNRIRGVPGFDVGHLKPGVHIPSNFRLENASSNRARPGIARRLGISDKYR